MSFLAKPATAVTCLVLAACTWACLILANIMLLVGDGRFAGNPIYTFFIAVAIALTIAGVIIRLYAALVAHVDATTEPRKSYFLAPGDITGEVSRSTVYRATANADETVETKRRLAAIPAQLAEVRAIRARLIRRQG